VVDSDREWIVNSSSDRYVLFTPLPLDRRKLVRIEKSDVDPCR
jgi:hypothetical protein